MIPVVWSERIDDDPLGRLHDCTEASALMVLVAAGYTKFPLGIYTWQERNALDRSSTRPPNTGDLLPDLDGAVQRRYGVTLHKLKVTTTAALARELAKPGRAYLLAGQLSHYEPGHFLRRWQPKFTGGHAVCYVADRPGEGLFLDPLAPNKYPGDRVTASVAAQFAWQDWEARYLDLDELIRTPNTDTPEPEEEDMLTIHGLWPERWRPTRNATTGASNGVFRFVPDRAAEVVARVPLGAEITSGAEVRTGAYAKPKDDGDWRAVKHLGGLEGIPIGATLYILRSDWEPVTPGGDPELKTAYDQLLTGGAPDCAAAVAQARQEATAELKKRAIDAIAAL